MYGEATKLAPAELLLLTASLPFVSGPLTLVYYATLAKSIRTSGVKTRFLVSLVTRESALSSPQGKRAPVAVRYHPLVPPVTFAFLSRISR